MPRLRASLLLHRGHGPRHGDLVLGTGARCLTWRLEGGHGRWAVSPAASHRRRYLTFRGPLGGGRGAVEVLWQGALDASAPASPRVCRVRINDLFLKALQRIRGVVGGPSRKPLPGRRQLVVRPPRPLRLLCS